MGGSGAKPGVDPEPIVSFRPLITGATAEEVDVDEEDDDDL